MTDEVLNEGQLVTVSVTDLTFDGVIRGISATLPIVGPMYIVEKVNGVISDVYPYSSCVVPGSAITKRDNRK